MPSNIPSRAIGFLIAVCLLCLLVFFWPRYSSGDVPPTSVKEKSASASYQIEFTAEFRHSETFGERIRAWTQERISEMRLNGCVRGVLMLYPKPEDENVTVAHLKCIEFEPKETKGDR